MFWQRSDWRSNLRVVSVTNEIGHENAVPSSCDAALALRRLLSEYPGWLDASPATYASGARMGEEAEEGMLELRTKRRGDNLVLPRTEASAVTLQHDEKANQNRMVM
jgi:hypothetical protein